MLKNTSTDKPKNDLQILDTKPGKVDSLNDEEKELLNDSFVKKEHAKSNFENTPVDSLGNIKEEKTKTNDQGIATEVVQDLVFAKPLDPNERKHFEIIVKSQRTAKDSLRRQVQACVAYIQTLPETDESKALIESLSTL